MPKRAPAPAAASAAVSGGMGSVVRSAPAVFLILFGLALLAYWPALRGGMLWDDDYHITRPELRSWTGLAAIWTTPGASQQYYPLLHSAFWLQHRLWGDATTGYHAVNVLCHALAGFLLWRVLLRLAVPGAFWAALLFIVHPLQVETVAWITEQKNTLSAVFYLGAALLWLHHEDRPAPAAAVGAFLLFVAALLTKSVTATLPAALLVLAWWRRGRIDWRRDVLPLLPWFAVGVGSGLFTAWMERHLIGAQGADFMLGPVARLLLAGRIFWFYPGKLAWPSDLIFIYPRWNVNPAEAGQWLFLIGAAGLAGVAWWYRRRSRAPLAALLLYAGTLFPVLGFLNVYPFRFSYVADHFQYLAGIPLIVLVAGTVARLAGHGGAAIRRWIVVGVAGVVLVLVVASWRQSRIYRSAEVLYEATLAKNPDCWMAQHNLGMMRAASLRFGEALGYFQAATTIKPDYPNAHYHLGQTLCELGRFAEAVPELQRTLDLDPGFVEAHSALGRAWWRLGDKPRATAAYFMAARLEPGSLEAQFNLGAALLDIGRPAEAIPALEAALRIAPNFPPARINLAVALRECGRIAEADVQDELLRRMAADHP